MKFLIDTSPAGMRDFSQSPLVGGQLITPTGRHANWGGTFAIDNGAYSGLDREAWFRLLELHKQHMDRCLFVAIPDVVGNHRRTSDLYGIFTTDKRLHPWHEKWAFVAQDGSEDAWIDWRGLRHLFIGGTDRFKDSSAAYDLCKTAKALAIPVHIGRVNKIKRYRCFAELEWPSTCDGTGLAKDPNRLTELEKILSGDQDQHSFPFEEHDE